MLRSINASFSPPSTSTPSVNGVTSTKSISVDTSPAIMAPCIAAPIATASIGSMPRSASFPITVPTNCLTIGILVGPPISIILSISAGDSLPSCNACMIEVLHRSIIGLTSSSSFALERLRTRFFGPDAVS